MSPGFIFTFFLGSPLSSLGAEGPLGSPLSFSKLPKVRSEVLYSEVRVVVLPLPSGGKVPLPRGKVPLVAEDNNWSFALAVAAADGRASQALRWTGWRLVA